MQSNIASTNTNATMQLAKVIPVNINDHLCYPKFMCVHLNYPGQEKLKGNVARYRQKDVLILLFENANNFDWSDQELHSKLFCKKQDGIRITWEYINMMVQYLGGQEFLISYPKDNDTLQKLTDFYDRNGSLPLNAEKSIIGLYRKMMMYDGDVEEVQMVQKSMKDTSAEIQVQSKEKRGDAMEV